MLLVSAEAAFRFGLDSTPHWGMKVRTLTCAGEHCCDLVWCSLQALESLDSETLRHQAFGTRMLCLQLEACSSFWFLPSWQVLIAEFVDGDACVQCAQLCFSAL